MIVAAYSWEVEHLKSESQFWAKLEQVCEEAHALGVQHLVLPESIILEMAGLFPDLRGQELIARLAEFEEEFVQRAVSNAERTELSLVAGSHFASCDGLIYNVSMHFAEGRITVQRKNVMTQFESVEWLVEGYQGLTLSHYQVDCATLICYDSEFPEAGRSLAEAGALLINVPAYTETQRGFQRVRWCANARAIENQVYVIHASLLGALGREPVPKTYGSSAVLCPSVLPFPARAVLAETELNEPGFAVAELDFEALLGSREQDDVRNWHDRHASDWRIEPAP